MAQGQRARAHRGGVRLSSQLTGIDLRFVNRHRNSWQRFQYSRFGTAIETSNVLEHGVRRLSGTRSIVPLSPDTSLKAPSHTKRRILNRILSWFSTLASSVGNFRRSQRAHEHRGRLPFITKSVCIADLCVENGAPSLSLSNGIVPHLGYSLSDIHANAKYRPRTDFQNSNRVQKLPKNSPRPLGIRKSKDPA